MHPPHTDPGAGRWFQELKKSITKIRETTMGFMDPGKPMSRACGLECSQCAAV